MILPEDLHLPDVIVTPPGDEIHLLQEFLLVVLEFSDHDDGVVYLVIIV